MEYLNENVLANISKELNVKIEQIVSVLEMLKDDKTVAFIARYRKEATGGLDEEAIRQISEHYTYGVNLEKRKADVIRLIEEKGMLTEELKNQIISAPKLIDVEDLYIPEMEEFLSNYCNVKNPNMQYGVYLKIPATLHLVHHQITVLYIIHYFSLILVEDQHQLNNH